ncbi:MAG: hypothetical protein BWY90_00547 [Deltaproteobacteria bacterium ADurb.BinA014]|nr:MAG: hypothetical protein BWY90_00547 [Deltaproteobacteria bacterium ADurb.BinA014]
MYLVFFSSSLFNVSRRLARMVLDLSLARKTLFLSLKSFILEISFKTLSRCSSSSTNPSSSSILSTTFLILTSPLCNFSPTLKTSFMETGRRNIAVMVSLAPSSIFLAISTSPSRLRRDTRPISRKYIFTGSPVLPAIGIKVRPSVILTGTVSSVVFFTISFSPCSVSIISIFFSPKSMIISSIWSEEVTSGGSISLTSSYVKNPFSSPSESNFLNSSDCSSLAIWRLPKMFFELLNLFNLILFLPLASFLFREAAPLSENHCRFPGL